MNQQQKMQQKQKERGDSLAILQKNTVDVVAERIRQYQEKGQLLLPPNYSPENAMKAAWLILQETKDRNGTPVLQSCTQNSIANALLDMVVQGLNPGKKQCYFIAYGDKLTCMRSYFGSMAIVKNICGAKDVYGEIVYNGDEFEYAIHNGNKQILKHVQKFGNIAPERIVGAYCTIIFDNDREFTEVMTLDQIKKAWKKSKMDTSREGSTHKEFPEEMCKRTVINRACKRYINSSSDNAVLLDAMSRADEIATDEEVAEEIEREANREVIDIELEKEPENQKENEPQKVEPKKSKAEQKEGELFKREPGF